MQTWVRYLVGALALLGAGVFLIVQGEHTVGGTLVAAGTAELGAKGAAAAP